MVLCNSEKNLWTGNQSVMLVKFDKKCHGVFFSEQSGIVCQILDSLQINCLLDLLR